VEIEFIGRDLHELCNAKAALVRRWGPERAALVAQRLAELQALDRLADLAHLPHIPVSDGEEGTEIDTGADVVLVVAAASDGQSAEREKLTVLAIEDREGYR
jgi:hypothetical protein